MRHRHGAAHGVKTHRKSVPSTVSAKKNTKKLIEVDESPRLDDILGQPRVGQDLLGLSDGQLREMYDNAMNLLEAQHFEGAVRGFSLLCQLHPYIADFWLGLGHARWISGQPEQALSAFLMAETMDCHRADVVIALVECSLELGNVKGAERVLKGAYKHLEDESISPEERRIFEKELTRMSRLVQHHSVIR